MKQWIREHPWRLEIVPAALILLAVILPLVYRTEAIMQVSAPLSLGGTAQPWLFRYLSGVFVMASWWAAQLANDHEWPVYEKDGKTFNWKAPTLTGLSAATGLFHAGNTVGGGDSTVRAALIVLAGVSLLVEILVERTRPSAGQRPDRPAIAAVPGVRDVRPGEPFYYSEVRISREWMFAAIGVVAVPLAAYWLTLPWWLALGGFIMVGMFAPWSTPPHARFVITETQVAALFGLRKLHLAMDDITQCAVEDFDLAAPRPFWEEQVWPPEPKPDRTLIYFGDGTPTRGLVIEARDGNNYLLGLRDPETACKLINTAIAARPKEAEA